MHFPKINSKVYNIVKRREVKAVETVFIKAMLLKGYLLIEDVLTMGPVCPFLSQLHTETVTRGILHPYHDKT